MSLTLLILMAITLRLQVNNRNKDFVFFCAKQESEVFFLIQE